MFTGLVGATGILADRAERGPGARLAVRATLGDEPLAVGESITVDGACLSVVEVLPEGFAVDATAETLARTTLGALPLGRAVNLERSLRAGDRLGGHLVTGHIDGVGMVAERRPVGEAVLLAFTLPPELARYVAEKGSIAVNGVSMTVNSIGGASGAQGLRGLRGLSGVGGVRCELMVIPITQRGTNLGALAVGDRVNLEVDLVARYVARLMVPADD